MRLRNLSGIIIIDFIDMKDAGMRRQLFEYLKELVQADPVKTVVVDTTRLNLVEMTRKKERKPLHELMAEPCPKCKGMGFVYDLSDVEAVMNRNAYLKLTGFFKASRQRYNLLFMVSRVFPWIIAGFTGFCAS